MKNYPKISYLIPTYNRSNYIVDAIEGALLQDYDNLEVIISDDASTDKTQEVVQKYLNDNRLIYYRNQENLGGFNNIKKLIYEYNNSDWFLIQSDDDYLTDKSYISKCVSLLNKYKNYDITLIGANFDCLYENSNIKINTYEFYPEIKDGKRYFLNSCNLYHTFQYPFSLQKTNVIRKLGCWTFDRSSEDAKACLMLSLNGYVAFLKDTVGVFRVYDNPDSSYMLPYKADNCIELVINDLSYIDEIYEYCQKMQIFPHKTIVSWRKKMIEAKAMGSILYLLKHDEFDKAHFLRKEIIQKYPFISLKKFPIRIRVFFSLQVNKNLFLKKLLKKLFRLLRLKI